MPDNITIFNQKLCTTFHLLSWQSSAEKCQEQADRTLLTAFIASLTEEQKSELLGFISTAGEVPVLPYTLLHAFPCQLAAYFLQANNNNFHAQQQPALRQ